MPLVDQYGRELRRASPARASRLSPSAGWGGLYDTPRNSGQSDFYRQRPLGITDLASALGPYELQELTDLSRQMVAQMPDLGAAILQKNQYAVGDAWKPQYLGKNAAWGEEAMEWLHHVWLPQSSLVGGFFDWQRDLLVSALSWDVDGDDLCIFVVDEDGFPKLAFRPSTSVGNGKTSQGEEVKSGPFDGAKICNGIIKDRQGRRLGVRVLTEQTRNANGRNEPGYVDLPAANCDMEAEPTWRVQDRGFPRAASGIMHLLDEQDIKVFLKRGVKLANSIGLVHQTESGEADPSSDVVAERVGAGGEASDIKIEKRLGGEMLYMKAGLGETITEVLSKRPSSENMEFLRSLTRETMLGVGWFTELLDPSRIGGASVRMIQDQARHSVADRQKTLGRRAKRALLFALAQAQQTKRISKNPDPLDWMKWGFGLPALITVDQGYDEQSDANNLMLGTTTMDAICQKKGRRWEDSRGQRLKEQRDLVIKARELMAEANAGAKDPSDKLTLRECIDLLYRDTQQGRYPYSAGIAAVPADETSKPAKE